MIKTRKETFSNFAKYSNLRLGSYYSIPKRRYTYIPFSQVISVCESGSRPSGGIQHDYSNQAINLGAEQIGENGLLNLMNIPYVPFEFYDLADSGYVKENDILICKDGALTGKICIANLQINGLQDKQVMINEHVYIIRANSNYNQLFLYFVMQSNIFQNQVKDFAYKKKGQPGLNLDHISKIKVPNVPLQIQEMIIDTVKGDFYDLAKKMNSVETVPSIINKYISERFGINFDQIKDIEEKNHFNSSLLDFAQNGETYRFSYRWNKASQILRTLQSVPSAESIDKHIVRTQNGWSPNCSVDGAYQVLSLDSLNENGILDVNRHKFSSALKNNLDDYLLKQGDFLISRGNTVDLVAMASVVTEQPDQRVIFPDLMIRIHFDKTIDSSYMAYIFNSFIGRLYFKYATKGKNQTMVKVSRLELNEFTVPLPDINEQRLIVEDLRRLIKNRQAQVDSIQKRQKDIRDRILSAI